MARVWQFTTAASRRALRWTRQLVFLLVSVCAAIALGFTLYVVSALPQLQPWHTERLHEEFSALAHGDLDFDGYRQRRRRTRRARTCCSRASC